LIKCAQPMTQADGKIAGSGQRSKLGLGVGSDAIIWAV